METYNNDTDKNRFTILLDKRNGGILRGDGTLGLQNDSDFYINVCLYKTGRNLDNYVQVDKDTLKTHMSRQLINPMFIELAFFETVNKLSANTLSTNPDFADTVYHKAAMYGIEINK